MKTPRLGTISAPAAAARLLPLFIRTAPSTERSADSFRKRLRNTRKLWPPNRGWAGGFFGFLAPRPAALALSGNARKLRPPNRGWAGGFLGFLAPCPAALALSGNARKLWPPNRGWAGGFFGFLAPRPADLALLGNARKLWPPNREWTGGFLPFPGGAGQRPLRF